MSRHRRLIGKTRAHPGIVHDLSFGNSKVKLEYRIAIKLIMTMMSSCRFWKYLRRMREKTRIESR